jgi:hypothetical protein
VVHRRIAGETLLVPVKGHLADLEHFFVLSRVGEWIWERLDGATEPERLVEGIVERFEVDEATAARDLAEFLADLSRSGLLEEAG